ncbi:formate/nitrite transporter family protein [Xanthobacter sp. KR7-225]|uniref:formate/nitrite transporter family protein n=1 Tax=Xanthobacter sp. KR7-225 TaxID=3156613 RepID=UPI0032B3F431
MARQQKAELGLAEAAPEDLSAEEKLAVEEHAPLRPLAVHEVIRREGVEELARPIPSLWWSGLTAGLSIGFSVVAQGTLHAALPEAPWRGLLASLGYAVGFLIVILGRYQLFTEITLTAVLPVLAEPSRQALAALMRLWATVLAANLVGTFLFALALASHGVLPPAQMAGIAAVAHHVAAFTATDACVRGIVAGWLVATVVWLLPSAEAARIWIIALLTAMIAALDLSHVISGSVEVFYLQLRGELGILDGAVRLLLPLLIGNVIGGAALFALRAHGQVREELEPQPAPAKPTPAKPAPAKPAPDRSRSGPAGPRKGRAASRKGPAADQ